MAESVDNYCCPPWNFSWIVQNELAGMAWPQTAANIRFLINEGIKHIVTLSPEKKPPVHAFPDIAWTEIPIKEFRSPSITQIKKFIKICELALKKSEPVGVHCRMGRGRTGVMAACYLVRFHDLSPERAITNVRLMRPGSIETYEQEKAVIAYTDYLRSSNELANLFSRWISILSLSS
ncbi:dual specificity protein phosphatase 23-like isoform X2 [Schistocerca nitens]|uniref:dual specificity protein phosphatase 23-like isoform X2 n=1 Tax=Schistocerca nitens TaxID=7011 RepID=UPI0021184FB4|nr:dual specificity protein phosphatase 23-like isoform X2 [Schistocerca nitens]